MSEANWHSPSTVALALCWGAFAVVWIAGHLYNVRHSPAVLRRGWGNWQWVIIVVAVVVALRVVPNHDWHAVTVQSSWLRWTGLGLLVVSTAFTLWARAELGLMWSSEVVAREGHELRTDGPYAIVRHPIYTGLLGMLAGSALLDGFGRWTVALAAGAVVAALKIRAEERLMTEEFPAEYPRYRAHVPALVPMPWRR